MPLIGKALQFGAKALGPFFQGGLDSFYEMSPESYAFKKQSEFAEKMAKDAFERESTYNSPEAQMQRYKDAGLNPNLIYGTGSASAGNTSASAPTASHGAPEMLGSMPQIFQMIMQVAGFVQDQKLKKAQMENLYSSATLAHQKDYSEQIRHTLLEQQYQHLLKLNPELQKQAKYKTQIAPYQLEAATLGNTQTRRVIENLVRSGQLMDKDIPIKDQILKSKELENKLLEAQAQMTEHGITNPQQFFQFLLMALLKTFN